LTITILHLD